MIKRTPAVMVISHSHGHDDGAQAIVAHLTGKYSAAMVNGLARFNIAERIKRDRKRRIAETLILEAPYPTTTAGIVAAANIPPQAVSLVLLLTDPDVYELDPTGNMMRHILFISGATGIGLGDITSFDFSSAGATNVNQLGEKTVRLIGYIEQALATPVVFIATGPDTVIDREPFKAHEQPDKSSIVTYGSC